MPRKRQQMKFLFWEEMMEEMLQRIHQAQGESASVSGKRELIDADSPKQEFHLTEDLQHPTSL
jgi:hypothetical protein